MSAIMDSHSAPTLQEELPAGNTTPVKLGFAVQAATPLFSPSLIQHSPATQGRFFSPQTARDLLDGHTEQMQIASMPGKVVGRQFWELVFRRTYNILLVLLRPCLPQASPSFTRKWLSLENTSSGNLKNKRTRGSRRLFPGMMLNLQPRP